MLHFFSEVERSEEEKGGGGFNVSSQIRQIDQFHTRAPSQPHGSRIIRLSRVRAQPVPAYKKKPPRNVPQRPRWRALSDCLTADLMLMFAKEKTF